MEYTKLGNTDIEISKICIGCMGFGEVFPDFHAWVVDQKTTESVVKAAFDAGINFFDTANCYSKGTSEEFLRRSIKNLGIARDKVVLASKVFFNEGGLSAKAIKREIDGTLGRLGTDYLDLYLIHRFDYATPIEETMQALDDLVRTGKVRAIGASEMYAYQLHNMQNAADKNGWTRFSVLQPHYNLIYREDERELLPVARQFGMTITPFSALAAGHLTRATWEGSSKRAETDKVARDKYDAYKENNMKIIARVEEVAKNHGVAMADVALAWLWEKGIESPICGCTKAERVADLVRALEIKLTVEEISYLEELYTAHELVGPAGRPGEKEVAGMMKGLKK